MVHHLEEGTVGQEFLGIRVGPVYPDVVVQGFRVVEWDVPEDIPPLLALPAPEVSWGHGEAGALLQAAGTATGASQLPCCRGFHRMTVDIRQSHPEHLALSGEA